MIEKSLCRLQSRDEHKGGPTVILAKTVKGYGLGRQARAEHFASAEEDEREGTARVPGAFDIAISDDDIAETHFIRPRKIHRKLNIF